MNIEQLKMNKEQLTTGFIPLYINEKTNENLFYQNLEKITQKSKKSIFVYIFYVF